MSYSLNAVTAPDAYSPGSTIDGVTIKRASIDVNNQAIYWQLKIPGGGGVGGVWDSTETFMSPGSRVVAQSCVGIRFRAAIPAANLGGKAQAIVTLNAVT